MNKENFPPSHLNVEGVSNPLQNAVWKNSGLKAGVFPNLKNKNYYTLIASLPYLPRFNKAERLPITKERLMQRLTMLAPDDFKLADTAAEFIAWRRQPLGRTNEEMVSIYKRGVDTIFESPLLKSLFELPVNQRTIMTALRKKELGLPCPTSREPWGAGPFVMHIVKNWEKPYFKLDAVFPWIVQAQGYLRSGELLKLEYLLMNLIWNKLDILLVKNYFGFERVIAYLLKWDILRQWLSYNKEAAKKRFQELVTETIDECKERLKTQV